MRESIQSIARKALAFSLSLSMVMPAVTTIAAAETWYVDDGTISIVTDENGTTVTQKDFDGNVITTQKDDNIVITSRPIEVNSEVVYLEADAPAQENAEPVIQEDPESVTPENEEPVTPENEEPVTPENEEPVTPENAESVTPENAESVTPENEEPVTPENEEPVIQENAEPVIQGNAEPVIQEDAEPVVQENAEPVIQEKTENEPRPAPLQISRAPMPTPPAFGCITVQTTGNTVAEFTIQNLEVYKHYSSFPYKNVINIQEGSHAVIKVSGENHLEGAGNFAAINVADKNSSLTITDAGGEKDVLYCESRNAAAIGSNARQDMSGEIHITGNVEVEAESFAGAAIGSGAMNGKPHKDPGKPNAPTDMDGTILIDGNAKLDISSDYGGAVGSGANSDLSGNIQIGGNAEIQADSKMGSGIGTGLSINSTVGSLSEQKETWRRTSDMSGNILIGDNAVLNLGDCQIQNVRPQKNIFAATGIGSGLKSDMSGTVTVGGHAKVNISTLGTGIGSGAGAAIGGKESLMKNLSIDYRKLIKDYSAMSGVITVQDDACIGLYNTSVGIGSGLASNLKGEVNLLGGTVSQKGIAGPKAAQKMFEPMNLIGAGMMGDFSGKIYLAKDAVIESQNETPHIGHGLMDVNLSYREGDPLWKDARKVQRLLERMRSNEFEQVLDSYVRFKARKAKKDPMYGSITIEKGATICGNQILNHADADPYLYCLFDPDKTEDMGHVNVYIVDPPVPAEKPAEKPAAAVEEKEEVRQSLLWVTANGTVVPADIQRDGDVLTVSCKEEAAELHTTIGGLRQLMAMGLRSLVFKTASAETTLVLEEAVKDHGNPEKVLLACADGKFTLTIGEKDESALLR